MIMRVRWRVVLPILNLILFVAFAVWGAQPRLLTAVFQENTNVPLCNPLYENPLYPLLPLSRLIAVAENAPAFILAALILQAAGISNQRFASLLLPLMSPSSFCSGTSQGGGWTNSPETFRGMSHQEGGCAF